MGIFLRVICHFLRAHGGTFLATLYEVESGKKSKKYLGKLKLRAAIMDFKVTTLKKNPDPKML
jgi:hypothetical protein